MADDDAPRKSPDSNQARLISTSSSPAHHRTLSTLSGSPSRASATARLATPVQGSPSRQELTTPVSRSADRRPSPEPLAGAGGSSIPGPGTSQLSQALREGLGKSPTRSSSRQPRSVTQSTARYESPDPRGQFTPGSYSTQLGRSPRGTEDIEVLRRHLAGPQGDSEPGSFRTGANGTADIAADDEFSSLQMQGGDTTRHIYRYAEKREREQAEQDGPPKLKRSLSMGLPKRDEDEDEDDISVIQMPGGFRRDHIRRTAGSPAPSSIRIPRPDYGTAGRAFTEPPRERPQFIANNFIEFLTLYGHFAGESLTEDDEVLLPDEYFSSDNHDEGSATDCDDRGRDDDWGESSTLLTPGKRRRRRKAREAGTGTPFGAAMLLLKSFVGTGVLFLPRAYLNGGMLFSNLVLLAIAGLSYYCFILLVTTRLKVHASFGDMGGRIYGKHFRNLINASLVLSQIGFSSAYIVFVAENLQAFVLAVSNCQTKMGIEWLILIQMVIFLPLSLYRNINNIQKLALIADLFICLGLVYLYYYDIKTIVHQGGVADIHNFNSHDWTLFIGTAIFTFEGIGLVIPIQSSMKDPAKFPRVLGTVMVIISVIFISAGAISYAAYGSDTKTVILLNMPQDSALVNTVQFLYSLAILMSTPLQIYPAIEITSQQLFSKTGKYNPRIKWQKNSFRFFVVILCACIAWAGANDLDKFVSIVGSFACIPLVFLYPPLMHYRAIATRNWQKIVDVALIVFGFVIMVYTTALTIENWVHGSNAKAPGYCDE